MSIYGGNDFLENWNATADAHAIPVNQGLLEIWDVNNFVPGPYFLKVSATRGDGATFEDQIEVAIDHPLNQISTYGGSHPDISNNFVVWESSNFQDFRSVHKQNIHLFDLTNGTEYVIGEGDGRFTRPVISGNIVVWRDDLFKGFVRDGEKEHRGIRACEFNAINGTCPILDIEPSDIFPISNLSYPTISGNRILWINRTSGRVNRGDGIPSSVWYCDYVDGICNAQILLIDGQFIDDQHALFTPHLSDNHVVWVAASYDQPFGQIYFYDLDEQILVPITDGLTAKDPKILGNTIVWADNRTSLDSQIFICEYDPVTQTCPNQPLISDVANVTSQESPDISGSRIVWIQNFYDVENDVNLRDLFWYDLETAQLERLTEGLWLEEFPAVENGRIVWSEYGTNFDQGVFYLEFPSEKSTRNLKSPLPDHLHPLSRLPSPPQL